MKLALAFLFAVALEAAPIITTSCTPGPCSPGLPTQILRTISINPTSFHFFAGAGTSGFNGFAQAMISIDYDFTTDGPLRAGLIRAIADVSADGSFSGGGSASVTFPGDTCAAGTFGRCTKNAFYAVQLGTLLHVNVTARSSSSQQFSSGGAAADLTIQLFEADGTTPVALFDPPGATEAPEPATALLLLGGLAAMAGVRFVRA